MTIPTRTAGTGSEVTFSSVITDTDENYKFTIKSSAIAARVAVIDPELTLTVPPAVTASTGIDALTHAIEGYTVTVTEPMPSALPLRHGANRRQYKGSGPKRRQYRGLDRYDAGKPLPDYLFSHSDVGSVHRTRKRSGNVRCAPRAVQCHTASYVMEYNLPEAVYKYARIARASMGVEHDDDEQAAVLGIESG